MKTSKLKSFLTIIIFTAIMSGLVACNDIAIVHDLNERDANEILVLLSKNNIKATKQKEIRNQDVFWIISTPPSDELQARSILVSNNLPRIRQGGLEGICKDTGLILTPKTERCRELLAFKGEIINSLESIPGVVSADVVLNIPEKEDFPDENQPQPRPTASVTLQYLADANVKTRLTEGKIQEFVANSITDLDSRDVTVIISYFEQKIDDSGMQSDNAADNTNKQTDETMTTDDATMPQDFVSIGGIRMDENSAKKFKTIAVLFLIVLLLLAVGFIYALLRMSRLRRQSSVPAVVDPTTAQQEADKKLLEA